jgi:hypothetical protein
MSRYINYNDLYCKPCGVHGHDKCPVQTFDCGKKLIPEHGYKNHKRNDKLGYHGDWNIKSRIFIILTIILDEAVSTVPGKCF